jgi:hypothetical protein
MTQRKPADKSWESWTEEQIRAAQECGAFDNLGGAGKPIPGLTGAYDPDWWVKELMRREGVSVLPDALEIRKRVEDALERLWELPRESQVRDAVAALNADIGRVNATTGTGPPTSLAVLDVETIVRQWAARRGEKRE